MGESLGTRLTSTLVEVYFNLVQLGGGGDIFNGREEAHSNIMSTAKDNSHLTVHACALAKLGMCMTKQPKW